MKDAGRSGGYIFGVWDGIALVSGIAAGSETWLSAGWRQRCSLGSSPAAGGVLAMLAETMVPEAFQDSQSFTGLITALGFLTAFLLIKASA